MSLCYPSTPKKLAMSVGIFLGGAALFSYGLHLWYKNVAPQQARTKARSDFVRETLKKKYGSWNHHCPEAVWAFSAVLSDENNTKSLESHLLIKVPK
ncbi:hypothetical protein SAY86_012431 [Trapa natans]|uniref:Uncharacterized protein n=1 Tax=Trapa natans TaxID=22666 RepID=A0AAN7MA04_TRANT|nr:hypothetical protein SAY86_012431 [Trapa natans]